MPTTASLESPLPRVLPGRPVVRDHLAMEQRGVAVVSWSWVLVSRVTTATHFGLRYRLHRWS